MSKLRTELQKENKTIHWIPEDIREGRFAHGLRRQRIGQSRVSDTGQRHFDMGMWNVQNNRGFGKRKDLEATQPKSTNRYILIRHGERKIM